MSAGHLLRLALVATFGLALYGARACAQERFPAEQIERGAMLFAQNCVTCHGVRMRNPQWGANLREFPRDARTRFLDSVTYGKRQMPPWEDLLKPEEVEALWSYVVAGEKDD